MSRREDRAAARAERVERERRAALDARRSIPCRCRACDHTWASPLFLPLPVARFVRVLRGITANGCPRCGATGRDVLLDSGGGT